MNVLLQVFEIYRITACECVHLVTRRPFRSRGRDDDHSNQSAMVLSFTEPELWLIEVLYCGNRHFRFSAPVTFTFTLTR